MALDFSLVKQKFLDSVAAEKNPSASELRQLSTFLDELNKARPLDPVLPSPRETCAVNLDAPKSAALFFDRLWDSPTSDDVPADIAAFGGTEGELWSIFSVAAIQAGLLTDRETHAIANRSPALRKSVKEFEVMIANEIYGRHNIKVVPMYSTQIACDRQYTPGDSELIFAAVDGLSIVNEVKLTWEQVLEFRRDETSKKNLRRMRHWLDTNFIGKSTAFVSDEIAVRLEDYEKALKKHGVETITGVMSDLLEDKFLLGVSAAAAAAGVAGGGILGALAAGTLAIGRVSLSVSKRMIDYGARVSGQGSEVAFVHEIQKLSR